MNSSRWRPKGVKLLPFGLSALLLVVVPINARHQELGTAMARAPDASPRHALIASPFGTIHAATFSFPRPIGTAMPPPPAVRLASLDVGDASVTGSLGQNNARSRRAVPQFPVVDRTLKGDFLAALPRPEEPVDLDLTTVTPRVPTADQEIEAAVRFEPFPEYHVSLSLEPHPRVPGDEPAESAEADAAQPDISLLALANDPDPSTRTSQLFFGDVVGSHAGSSPALVPWAAGEEPILMLPRAPADDGDRQVLASLPDAAKAEAGVGDDAGGETVAGKGQVTGEGLVPNSPAERLALTGKAREKAEKCLANAVYFEARGESVRGQIAVAQVVLNRTFSGYYPTDVCGVVYQNSHRHLACQFTFACDGIPDVVTEQDAWDRASRIAKATLDGKVW